VVYAFHPEHYKKQEQTLEIEIAIPPYFDPFAV